MDQQNDMAGRFGVQCAQIHLQSAASPKKIIRGNGKQIRKAQKHFDRGLNIVVFPIGNGLLGYAELFASVT